MWKEVERIIVDRGAIVLFSQQPFTSKLVMSNLKLFKYEWIWEKPMATGFLNAHHAPMKCHENICIFSKSAAAPVKDKSRCMYYFPQPLENQKKEPYTRSRGNREKKTYGNFNACTSESVDGSRFPRDVFIWKHPKEKNHPTAKPVDLCEYLIKTYTKNPVGNERKRVTVLDFCAGSGVTGVACMNTGRYFIGIELEKQYYNIMEKRLLTSDN